MVLTLYHDDKEPQKVFNVISVTLDDSILIVAKIKDGVRISQRQFRHKIDYQRFTVNVD